MRSIKKIVRGDFQKLNWSIFVTHSGHLIGNSLSGPKIAKHQFIIWKTSCPNTVYIVRCLSPQNPRRHYIHQPKNRDISRPETMCQILPDIVSDSLHLAKSCPPETMCRISPNFAKLWSSITPKRQTMGAWQTPHWNREVKIKLFKKKFEPESPL